MSDLIFTFALVVAVVASGAAVWCTLSWQSEMRRQKAAWQAWSAKLREEQRKLESAIEKTSSSKLAAEVDDLRAAFATNRAAIRREMGSLWGRLGGRVRPGVTIDGDDSGDPELDDLLALQRASPVQPGAGNGSK